MGEQSNTDPNTLILIRAGASYEVARYGDRPMDESDIIIECLPAASVDIRALDHNAFAFRELADGRLEQMERTERIGGYAQSYDNLEHAKRYLLRCMIGDWEDEHEHPLADLPPEAEQTMTELDEKLQSLRPGEEIDLKRE
jgi:hypothetical protein